MADTPASLTALSDLDARRPLRILVAAPLPFFCDGVETFSFGGSVFFSEFLPRLARLGHQVRVLAEAPATPHGQQLTGLPWTIPDLTVEWFALRYRAGSSLAALPLRDAEEIEIRSVCDRAIKEWQPDIVLIGREALARHMVDLCQEYGLPSVLIVHGSPTAAFVRDTYPDTVRRELVECFARVNWLVTVAPYLEEIVRSFGLTQVCTIPNVTDPARFRPEVRDQRLLSDLRIASHQVVVGHVSNLKQTKRPLDVVRSAELVLKSNPNVVYVIVGDGPGREEMEELGRSKGIAASFRYVGEIGHHHVPQYLNLMDIVLLPSEHDGVPLLVYRETQACGRVLLVSDIPAAREVLTDGETGVFFRLGDLQDLAAKVLALARDPAGRQRIGQKARTASLSQSPDLWIHAYERVLRCTALRVSPLQTES